MKESLDTGEKGNGKGKKTIVVAQTGGPSAVINSTLAGIIEEAQKNNIKVIGLVNAFEGLLADNTVDLSKLTAEEVQRLRATPGAFLGASRLQLTEEIFNAIPQLVYKLGGTGLLLIGGNGTMYAAHKISEITKQAGIPLQVLGVPKTVDNDVVGLERTPGFGSAARFVAQAVLDIGTDLESMKTFEQVRIIEVMGRSVGWLAAASGLAKTTPDSPPHLIYLPEQSFDEQEFLADVKRIYETYGFVVAVVGEGIKDKEGNPVGASPFAALKNGSRIYGGAANYLASLVSESLKIRARAQDLTMAQRCFAPSRSEVDEREAYQVGQLAVSAFCKEKSDYMVCWCTVEAEFSLLPLAEVGGKEKTVPENYYNEKTKEVTPDFIQWLRGAVGDWEPGYLRLSNLEYKN